MDGLHAVIMAGGSGTRFWPASRRTRPKHFLPLAAGRPLIAAAVDRARDAVGPDRVWIVTNADQAPAMSGVLDDFPEEQIIVEPEPRDTAPCVALATAWIESRDPGATVLTMPADHLIASEDAFQALLQRATALAADHRTLVTFGIRPDQPSTAYGYIERGDVLDQGSPTAWSVRCFREKPDVETARGFIASGEFLWNSGIFVWTTRAIMAAMEAGNPDLAASTAEMIRAAKNQDQAALAAGFRTAAATSIDYAVMEKAPQVAVLEAEVGWSDLGSFPSLVAAAPADSDGNISVLSDGADLITEDSRDCIVYGEGARTVALFGARDLVVVAVEDTVLVCPRARAEELKTLVEKVRAAGRQDLL